MPRIISHHTPGKTTQTSERISIRPSDNHSLRRYQKSHGENPKQVLSSGNEGHYLFTNLAPMDDCLSENYTMGFIVFISEKSLCRLSDIH
jgi:hypothetical protein